MPVFFFKQKTAYERRISDWSSDVCSSDLGVSFAPIFPSESRDISPMSSTLFTSESVSEGHPDKIADQISDAVLDAILAQDKRARVACETMVKTGVAIVAGEITTSAWIDLEALTRTVTQNLGYKSTAAAFTSPTRGIE